MLWRQLPRCRSCTEEWDRRALDKRARPPRRSRTDRTEAERGQAHDEPPTLVVFYYPPRLNTSRCLGNAVTFPPAPRPVAPPWADRWTYTEPGPFNLRNQPAGSQSTWRTEVPLPRLQPHAALSSACRPLRPSSCTTSPTRPTLMRPNRGHQPTIPAGPARQPALRDQTPLGDPRRTRALPPRALHHRPRGRCLPISARLWRHALRAPVSADQALRHPSRACC
jgi:hypothetical protein